MAKETLIPLGVLAICNDIYDAVRKQDFHTVHRLNIRLVNYRAKPEHRERAERTKENLKHQLSQL
jgi:hypothetical protein